MAFYCHLKSSSSRASINSGVKTPRDSEVAAAAKRHSITLYCVDDEGVSPFNDIPRRPPKKKGESGNKQTVRINVQYYKHIKADESVHTDRAGRIRRKWLRVERGGLAFSNGGFAFDWIIGGKTKNTIINENIILGNGFGVRGRFLRSFVSFTHVVVDWEKGTHRQDIHMQPIVWAFVQTNLQ